MRKSTFFISAILTTFALFMLYEIASAYRENNQAAAVMAQPSPTSASTVTDVPVALDSAITPEAAAQLAAQVIGNSNLLSAESAQLDGVDSYKITFTNKDVVYIGLDGQVLSVEVAPGVPVVVNAAPLPKHRNHRNNGNAGNNSSSNNGSNNQENPEGNQEHED